MLKRFKMRLAFDHQIFVMQPYGGISRYFAQIAQGLLTMDQQVMTFAPLHINNYIRSLSKEIFYGRYIHRFPPKTVRFFLAYNHFLVRSKILKWKPDVVHETYYSRFGSAPKDCQSVITVYDMIHELFPDEMPVTDNTSALKRISVDRADAVICISENTKQDLMRLFGTPANKISVVHLGFDQFLSKENNVRENSYSEKPFLLYVGQRAGYKNFSGFLKSVAVSKNLLSDFEIIAFGGRNFSSSELGLINSLGFSEGQVQHKSGGDDILGKLYDSARAFVYPSVYEGFGIPPLEAMAHSCPVISSNTSSMPEVIGRAAEYFNPLNIDDMKYAIEKVVYSESRIKILKALGENRLLSFSWDKCTQDTLNVYRSLAV